MAQGSRGPLGDTARPRGPAGTARSGEDLARSRHGRSPRPRAGAQTVPPGAPHGPLGPTPRPDDIRRRVKR